MRRFGGIAFAGLLALAIGMGLAATPAVARESGDPAHGREAQAGAPDAGYQSALYADRAHWLCRPDVDDVCKRDLDSTIVRSDGSTSVQRWRPARRPKIDCCALSPTI